MTLRSGLAFELHVLQVQYCTKVSLKLAGDISLAGHSEGEDESYNIVKEQS